jgi:hypothetical protein
MGIVGVETKEDEKKCNKENNKNVEDIDNSFINIYKKIQIIKSRNDKNYYKFNFNKNNKQECNSKNYNVSKPIPIPAPYL